MRDDDVDANGTTPSAGALGSEKLPDGTYVPKLHVMLPGQDAPTEFRHASFVIPDGEQDSQPPDGDPALAMYCLMVNGNGDVWVDATSGEPIMLPAPPAVIRFDDQAHVKMAEAEKITGVSRQTLWRAVRDAKLEAVQVGGKHTRY